MSSRSADLRPDDELVDPALSFLSNQFYNHTKKLGCFKDTKNVFSDAKLDNFLDRTVKILAKKLGFLMNMNNSFSFAKLANFLERIID
jgi:hypothetical protein